mgnify:CR=1 FL=1
MIDEPIGVIFDWDGVIIDSHDQHELSWQKLAEENNKKISKILAETDIVKNSIADPIASEKKINEEVVNMFNGINAATQ